MIYLSKGLICAGSTEDRLAIEHCGFETVLTGTQAALWLNGSRRIASTNEAGILETMRRAGLVEYEQEDNDVNRYRLFSRCILCPSKKALKGIAARKEKELLVWLTKAGLRLTTAELIFLTEHKIQPDKRLLYVENRQALVETIYTADTIPDNILEAQMEHAQCRDSVIKTLLRLLKTGKLIII